MVRLRSRACQRGQERPVVTLESLRGIEVGCRLFPTKGTVSRHQATSDVAKGSHRGR